MTKAIALLSGGLDSILAVKLILQQGIEVEAVNFLTAFYASAGNGTSGLTAQSAADKLGIKLKIFEAGKKYFEIVKRPKYGYGSNMNPCIDCRIFMLKKAADYMRKSGASFLITGEVLGERPMSQRRDAMRVIERDAALEGLILRPLSAKLLKPTIPEEKGVIDREKLLAINGRSRKPQIQLANQLGINDYPVPAGGCLLTDPGFSNRIRDLIRHKPDFDIDDIRLLKIGRHFRLAPEAKLVVGRNKEENNELLKLAKEDDFCFYPVKTKGPVGIGRGVFSKDYILRASNIIARYSDGSSDQQLEIAYKPIPGHRINSITATPIEESALAVLRI